MNSQVLIDRELLELAYNAVHALMGMGIDGFTAERCKELRHLLATPAPIPDAGEGVDFWWADEPLASRALVMKVADHNRIVSALQASAMVVPDKRMSRASTARAVCDGD